MKPILLNVLVMLISASNLWGQTLTQIGTGMQAPLTNNSIYSPICRFSASSGNDCSRSNLLYTDVELTTAGIVTGTTISQISFYKIGTGASVAGFTFQIYMRNSTTAAPLSTTTTWANITSTHTLVYSTTAQNISSNTGWVDFVLATPFVYTGQNLEIAMSYDMTAISGSPTTGPFDWQYTTGFQNYVIGSVSTTPPATLNGTVVNYKVRPNIQIGYTAPLSVKLISFTGQKNGNTNKLAWITASETNNTGFELQRSSDGVLFSSLAFINADPQANGSEDYHHYSFDDNEPLSGTNWYRLKQIDNDGKFEFSRIVSITGNKLNEVRIVSIHPNPADDLLGIKMEVPNAQRAFILISDFMGRLVVRQQAELLRGEHQLTIPVANLAQGNYFARVSCADGCQNSAQFFVKK